MTPEPELEISLHRSDEESYSAEVRFRDPQNDQTDRRAEEYPIKFDFAQLASLAGKVSEHGKLLGKSLFVGKVRDCLLLARGTLAGRALRVRLSIDRWSMRLHRLRWEALCDPDTGLSLVTDENVWFSRHLSSFDMRAVCMRPRRSLRILAAVASPNNLEDLGKNLMPIDVDKELELPVNNLMGIAHLEKLPHASLKKLEDALREDYDVLYLVCHGAFFNNEPRLVLEKENGEAELVSAKLLVASFASQLHLPRLVVLASCQSAGQGNISSSNDEAGLVAIGPRLAEVGIPAVVAMHGNLLRDTHRLLMPRFFQELLDEKHGGQIDRALTLARNDVKSASDCWAPVLFTRLVDGRLWRKGNFGKSATNYDSLESVVKQLKVKQCVPILGPGMLEAAVGLPQDMARRWADSDEYPLFASDLDNFPRVAQYVATNLGQLPMRVKFVEDWITELWRRWPALKAVLIKDDEAPQQYLLRLFQEVWPLLSKDNAAEPHRVLARLGCPLYVTTNPDSLMALALQGEKRQAAREICPWWQGPADYFEEEADPSAYEEAPVKLEAARPLVYHLYGHLNKLESLVLSEDDFFKFLLATSKPPSGPAQGATANQARVGVRLQVRQCIIKNALLIVGFRLDDWNFRFFLETLKNFGAWDRRSDTFGVHDLAVQIEPDDRFSNPLKAQRHLERYFTNQAKINIFWGSVTEFMQELNARW